MSASPHVSARRRTATSGHREAALEAALWIASSAGLEAISIGGVAARAELPKSTVQTLFADRAALQVAALTRGVDRFARFVQDSGALPVAPLARLARLLDLWMTFVVDRRLPGGCLISGSLVELRATPGPLQAAVLARAEEWKRLVVGLLEAAASRGELAPHAHPDSLFRDLRAIQLAANVAACLSDRVGTDHARARLASLVASARADG